jgi:hypothetical protein
MRYIRPIVVIGGLLICFSATLRCEEPERVTVCELKANPTDYNHKLIDCRSTFCSRMYAAGIQPVLIELLMGHAGNSLVHTYAKADDDFKRDAAAKLEAFIASKNAVRDTLKTPAWVN